MKKIPLRHELETAPFFRVLETSKRGQVAVMCLRKGEASGPTLNVHPEQDQFVFIVSGEGVARTDGREIAVKAGDLLHIEPGEAHQLKATSDDGLKTVDFYSPPAY